MNRVLSVLAATAIAVPSVFLVAAPAGAEATTGTEVVTERDGGGERAWTLYRRFEHMVLCEAAGAAGVLAGRWTQWRCDQQNVLWVNAAKAPAGG
ncbi:hypothetical protein [Lentzea californiensis]|uniref:hypothetical protein n=1 Tax=Lentzea californiensis TaxID=438851 RepID=UPI0021659EAC|nr:hypothetical protein [Lentzea californiensis]MCR3750633.1 hypothetical protein [Lentzea californiensis]